MHTEETLLVGEDGERRRVGGVSMRRDDDDW